MDRYSIFEFRIRKCKSRYSIFFSFADSFETRRIPVPGVFISTQIMTLKFLRIFGHLIVKIHVDFHMFKRSVRHPTYEIHPAYEHVLRYLNEYGSNSFIEISLQCLANTKYYSDLQFIDWDRPFSRVQILQFEDHSWKDTQKFSTIFPNIHTLKIGRCYNEKILSGPVCLPSLKHLSIYGTFYFRFKHCNVIFGEFLRLNPQLEKLELYIPEFGYSTHILEILRDSFSNLKYLKYFKFNGGDTLISNLVSSEHIPIHFEHIEHIEHFSYKGWQTPFTFSKLEQLSIHSPVLDFEEISLQNIINSNEHLKSILMQTTRIFYAKIFLKLENVLMNITEISMGLVQEDDLRPECILQF